MRYSISFVEQDFKALTSFLFSDDVEQAAYLLCRTATTTNETRILVRQIISVEPQDINHATATSISIPSPSYIRAMKFADQTKHCMIFVHSHPNGPEIFSTQDDIEESSLFNTAYTRIESSKIHGSLVFTSPEKVIGRVWLPDLTVKPIDVIRVLGQRFRFYFNTRDFKLDRLIFDRQIKAFGVSTQGLLSRLHAGIVGAGGTGSSVAEQLTRLGIGKISVFDGQCFEKSNVTRVYGSRSIDEGIPKVKIIERMITHIGLNTSIQVEDNPITRLTSAQKLRDCDIVFGCTDDEWGRSILTRLALFYYIPIFDMGVKIETENDMIESVPGRVTTLMPGSACLYCRDRITARGVRAESMQVTQPAEAKELQKQGYLPELEDMPPAVIPFTTAIASSAIAELLHRITGFMGGRTASEIIHRYDMFIIGKNDPPPQKGCICADPNRMGKGDVEPFLDLTWAS